MESNILSTKYFLSGNQKIVFSQEGFMYFQIPKITQVHLKCLITIGLYVYGKMVEAYHEVQIYVFNFRK